MDNEAAPPAAITREELEDAIHSLTQLRHNRAFRLFQTSVQEQYDELVYRLAKQTDPYETARLQGSLRAVADILENPNAVTANVSMLERLIDLYKLSLAELDEDEGN